MSYTTNYYHVVFRTVRSIPAIAEMYEVELYKYIWGFCRNKSIFLHRIGGMPDHLHLLVDLPPNLSLAEFVKELKTSTNHWLRGNPHFPLFSGWSIGYAGLSCSTQDLPRIVNYISNQKQHHQAIPLHQEMRNIFEQSGIEIEEAYFQRDWNA